MHREGHIMEEVVKYRNIPGAFDTVLHGSKRKGSRQGRSLLEHREEVIAKLIAALADGSFRLEGYHERGIKEYGKRRRLQVPSMRSHIAVFAVTNVVDRYLRKRHIRTTGVNIRGHGTHDLMKCICTDMAADPGDTRYAYKFNIRRFYDNAWQDFIIWCSRRVFKDEELLTVLERFVTMLPEGIDFELRGSQGVGNLFLSVFLGHYLKNRYGVCHYYRYCDDDLILGRMKVELWTVRHITRGRTEMTDLEVKPNERVFPVEEGVDFLGYIIRPDYVRLRKRVKQKFAQKMREVKSRKRRRELVASFYGVTKHADCNKLFNKLTGKEVKSFKELNVTYKSEDGKKRFPGTVVGIRELINLPIIVKGFEAGIRTDQGDDRCTVSTKQNDKPRKFSTNSEEMKNILAQIREVSDRFPFEITIRTGTFDKGRTKYIFT